MKIWVALNKGVECVFFSLPRFITHHSSTVENEPGVQELHVFVRPDYEHRNIGQFGALHPRAWIPSNVVYGTKLDIQTKVLVVPAAGYQWEVDSDGTEADLLAWQALVGNNAEHSFNAPAVGSLNANPRLATGAASTLTQQWRIVRVSGTGLNQDFTGANVKLIVKINEGAESPYTEVGT